MSDITVMIVEDDPNSRDILENLLQFHDVEAISVETAEAGLALLKEKTPDLILIDLDLPVMNGVDMLREIRANPLLGSVAVVAITAHDLPLVASSSLEAGFDAYFSKPIRPKTFVESLLQILVRS